MNTQKYDGICARHMEAQEPQPVAQCANPKCKKTLHEGEMRYDYGIYALCPACHDDAVGNFNVVPKGNAT